MGLSSFMFDSTGPCNTARSPRAISRSAPPAQPPFRWPGCRRAIARSALARSSSAIVTCPCSRSTGCRSRDARIAARRGLRIHLQGECLLPEAEAKLSACRLQRCRRAARRQRPRPRAAGRCPAAPRPGAGSSGAAAPA